MFSNIPWTELSIYIFNISWIDSNIDFTKQRDIAYNIHLAMDINPVILNTITLNMKHKYGIFTSAYTKRIDKHAHPRNPL